MNLKILVIFFFEPKMKGLIVQIQSRMAIILHTCIKVQKDNSYKKLKKKKKKTMLSI